MPVPFDAPVSTDFNADTTQPPLLVCVVPFRLAHGTLEVGVTTAEADEQTLLVAEPAIGDSLDMTAQRLVAQASGHHANYLEQLYTFSPRSGTVRQVVISYIALFRDTPDSEGTILETSPEPAFTWMSPGALNLARSFDRTVLDYALVRLRAKFGYTSIAFHLLPITFTLTDLQQAYEAVLGHGVDKRNFRRRMSLSGILADTGEQRRDGSHRPAALYRFVTRDDQAAYLTPSWASERPSSRSGEPE